MNNYAIYHVENYGHGKAESNTLKDEQKVTIEDKDGHFDVYECESESEAQKIATWYLDAVFGSYPAYLEIVKHDPRYFEVREVVERFQVSYDEDEAGIFMDFYDNYEEASKQANMLLNEGKTPTISIYDRDSCTEILERDAWADNTTQSLRSK